MNGFVVGLQPRCNLVIVTPIGRSVEIECVVDTGFEGFLTLPLSKILEIGLPCAGRIDANLADSSSISTEVYWATIQWKDQNRDIAVLGMGDRPLIGTGLLADWHLGIDFCDGGLVAIDEIL